VTPKNKPSVIDELLAALRQAGSEVHEVLFRSPNNRIIEAATSIGVIRLVVDRSQWFIELAPPDVREFFDTAVWDACCRGTPVSLNLIPLREQVDWLEAALEDGKLEGWSLDC
jgi:hypothetical protein